MEPFIGEIRLFPYTFAPVGWHVCNGATIAISTNLPLFSLLGAAFGGDGKTNFAVPNLLDKVPISQGIYCIAMQGVFPERALTSASESR
jgi:microcystin-dependent protein